MYPVFDVSDWAPERPEMLGSKEKIWLIPTAASGLPPVPHLFKIGRPNTGENWAEKVAFEIALELGLPCAGYELAARDGTRGVISRRFIPAGTHLAFGNLVLSQMIPDYDMTLKFKQDKYQLHRMLGILRLRGIRMPVDCPAGCAGQSGDQIFVGYLILDTLIGNGDRHHDNWGVIVRTEGEKRTYHLAPTFDHASSMGRELTDAARALRLSTKDQRGNVEAYADRCRSAFFGAGPTEKTLTSRQVLEFLAVSYPDVAKFWAQKAVDLTDERLEEIFREIDGGFISESAIKFAMRLLRYNRQQISEVILAK